MKKFILHVLYFFLLSSLPVISEDTFTINGEKITVPLPEGFIRVTEDMGKAYETLINNGLESENQVLAFYAKLSDLPILQKGDLLNVEQGFALEISKKLRDKKITAEDFATLKSTTKTETQKIFQLLNSILKRQPDFASYILDSGEEINLKEITTLEAHLETKETFAYSFLMEYDVISKDVTTTKTSAETQTLLHTTKTVLYISSHAKKEDLQWTRSANQKWAESILAKNKTSFLQSVSEKADWADISEKVLIAVIACGVITLIYSVSSYLRMNA